MRRIAHRPLSPRGARVRLLLLALAAAPLAAQSWDFPHRTHLEFGLDCQACHAGATSSKVSTDHLIPDGQVCDACHNGQTAPVIDTSRLAQADPAERSYRFDHEFHLGLESPAPLIAAAIDSGDYYGKPGDARRFLDGATACTGCHRGLEESLAVDPATDMPRMGDCIVCHTRVDNPFSCKECHIEGVELLPADHTRDFIDQHSTGRVPLDKPSCLPCHGRNFACMGCH